MQGNGVLYLTVLVLGVAMWYNARYVLPTNGLFLSNF